LKDKKKEKKIGENKMFPIKLLKSGEQILRSYCKNREDLFKVKEKSDGFKIISPHVTWIGRHILRQGQMMEINKQEDNSFDLYLSSNIIYELYFEELFELINFIDKIRDKSPREKLDLRLFKDKDDKKNN
jgi:hypothetical protein